MTEIVRRLNIARYMKKLVHPDSESQRRMLARLLAEEAAKAPARQEPAG